MLIAGIVLGFVVALLAGGRVSHLLEVRLRLTAVILVALVIRLGTEVALDAGVGIVQDLRLPLFTAGFGLLVYSLYANRLQPGLLVAAAGVAANAVAVVVNLGFMPVWAPALAMAGMSPADLTRAFHVLLPNPLDATFLAHAGFLADIIPIPAPLLTNVASVGDIFISAGLGWFIFATMLRGTPRDVAAASPAASSLAATSLPFERPTLLGGSVAAPPAPPPLAGVLARFGGHPYVRLALDARFSSFWIGQTVSLFGDRLHQVALGVLVLGATGSPLATGLVFLAATLPNLLLGPLAGTFVDRWNQKAVLVVSDFLRAGLVLLMPIAALQDILYVYPLVFLVTCVSIFFRPAKDAVVPRLVAADDLMAANSANWTGETLADIAGYPLAGVFVTLLGSALPIAFWADAATYLVSGTVILGLVIPPVARTTTRAAGGAIRRFQAEFLEGWHFLRGQASLYQNTILSAVAQTSTGVLLALTVVYAREVLDGRLVPYPANYSLIDAAIGIGNLVGGVAVGTIGVRLRKGWLISLGIAGLGLSIVWMGLTTNIVTAAAAAVVAGVANLVFIIPTQTLFAELTPRALMGRVVAIRSSLVYGGMMGAMAVASLLAEAVSVSVVFVVFGLATTACGVAAALMPAIRDS